MGALRGLDGDRREALGTFLAGGLRRRLGLAHFLDRAADALDDDEKHGGGDDEEVDERADEMPDGDPADLPVDLNSLGFVRWFGRGGRLWRRSGLGRLFLGRSGRRFGGGFRVGT